MRQLYVYVANESTRRLDTDGMSTGLTNTHTAREFSLLYYVFAQKHCILCKCCALRHKSYLSLQVISLFLLLSRPTLEIRAKSKQNLVVV